MAFVATSAEERASEAEHDSDAGALDSYRHELTGFCYRMLGSGGEAEDAVQEVMLRAWRGSASFEGRSSQRSWLYRIATNVCIDMLRGRSRRALPIGLGAPSPPDADLLGPELPEHAWVSPVPDAAVLPPGADPAEVLVERETIRLAFVTALQQLPPRQRAVLLLSQVLRFEAAEIASQLDSTVAAVNSALQRARATLAALPTTQRPADVGAGQAELLARYVDAFERYDIDAFVGLLHADAIQSMPPVAMWMRGAGHIGAWMLGPGAGCRNSRLIPTAANGAPAFGQYRPDPAGGHSPWSLHVLEIRAGRIAGITYFLDTDRVFPLFGLPARFPA
jgi:RNA polymerase sigma-70 factor (ECF subfamily)